MKIRKYILGMVFCAIFLIFSSGIIHTEELSHEKKNRKELNHYTEGLIQWYLIGDRRAALKELIVAETYDPFDVELKKSIASIYFELGNYSQALLKAQDAMCFTDNNVELYLLAASSAAAMGKCDLAKKYTKNTGFGDVNNIARIAWCYAKNDKPKKAISLCKKAQKKFPASPIPSTIIGRIYLSIQKPNKAIEPFEKAILLDPAAQQSYVPLANAYFQDGQFGKAMDVLDSYLSRFPGDREVFEQYINRVLVFRGLDEASDKIETFMAHFPDGEIQMREAYASAAYVQQNHGEALNEFLHLIELTEGTDASHFYFAGHCYEELWCPESSAIMYRCALELEPTLDLWTDLALLWAREDEPESLFTTLNQASIDFPDSARLWYWGAVALRMASVWEMATHWFAQALKYAPNDVQTMFSLADTRERAGYRAEAIVLFGKIIEIEPDEPLIQNYLGYILVDDSTKIQYGKSLIEKALDVEPDNAAYLDSYGWALYREGKPKNALKYLLKAEEKYSADPEINIHLCEIYEQLGNIDKAQEYAKKAIQIDPQNKKARYFYKKLLGAQQ